MEPLLGELRIVAHGRVPRGWMPCSGQILTIAQYQALFSLIGTRFGGDGVTNFRLPDLGGRIPRGADHATLGEAGGEREHALTQNEMPAHVHSTSAAAVAVSTSPAGNVPAGAPAPAFAPGAPDALMHPATIGTSGHSLPHENMPPFQAMQVIIAVQGLYPSRP